MDNFIVYLGIRFVLDADADVTELETGVDPRLRAAKREGLKTRWGRLTDGEYYFVLIGEEVGIFGVEATLCKSLSIDSVLSTRDSLRRKLRAAGFDEEPALHFQVQAEY